MNKKKIVTFILITYGVSWLIWMPNVIGHHFGNHWVVSSWFHLAGGLGPFIGALSTTLIFEKKLGLKQYITEKFKLPSLKWVLFGIGMPILIFLIPYLLIGLMKGDWVDLSQLGINSKVPTSNPALVWLIWCLFYGLGEEGGWRGFLFPELSKSYKERTAALLTVTVWMPWHLPVFFYDKDLSNMGLMGIIGWMVGLTFGAMLLGWLVKQGKWNLWPVILWHGTFNFFNTSDNLDFIFPSIQSMAVIVSVIFINHIYDGEYNRIRKLKFKKNAQ